MNGAALDVRNVRRQLATLLPQARSVSGESTLELVSQGNDAPRLISATVVEGGSQRARRIAEPPVPGVRAFLDGTQRSEVLTYVGSVPIVIGKVAAVIRERRGRRMHTWRTPVQDTRIYAPRALLSAVTWSTLADAFDSVLVDTTEGGTEGAHPFALRDAAFHSVQAHREAVEQQLAQQWCTTERDVLFIDGGISGTDVIAESTCTIGVVKSHRTLYAEGEALEAILALRVGERSSVMRITSPRRTTVASFYLRLRDHEGHDPMWSLVRVEMAFPSVDAMDRVGERADLVSRWVLAEVSPLALPDGRWDKMVYGVRDCEEYLRAIA